MERQINNQVCIYQENVIEIFLFVGTRASLVINTA